MSNSNKSLEIAKEAIARGDYGQSLKVLEKLAEKNPLPGIEGAKIRMLMVTAWMGQGQDQAAINTCRLLTKCKDSELRLQAKQLLSVLEAPSLEKPTNWSITLPKLDATTYKNNNLSSSNSKGRHIEEEVKLPPTGPTQPLRIGFSALVCIVLIALTILLSGCVRITTEINLPRPDRVFISWDIESTTKRLLPWQKNFTNKLLLSSPKLILTSNSYGQQTITSPIIQPKKANLLLKNALTIASESGGFELIESNFTITEENLFIGVKQNLNLSINLKQIPSIPGLDLSIIIKPATFKEVVSSTPNDIEKMKDSLAWKLKVGQINDLNIKSWQWNSLSIGSIVVLIMVIITLALQRLRLKLGFGFPELPP